MKTLSQSPTRLSRAERRAAVGGSSRAARRAAARGPVRPRRSSVWWWIAGALVLIVIGGGLWYTTAQQRLPAPSGPMLGQQIPDEGFEHVAVGTQIHYRANPPASGPHFPVPAPAGVYSNGLQTGFWVHSLEHGYIVLLYKPPVAADRLAEFDRMVKEFPRSKYGNVKLLIVSNPEMPRPYAVLAWDWRLQMASFDRATVLQFYRQHVDHGREDIP